MPNAQPDRRGRRRSACAGLQLRLLGALLLLLGGGLAVAGCQQQQAGAPGPAAASPFGGGAAGASAATFGDADEFLVVDCLLPAQVRRLGGRVTYLGQRRAIRTPGLDCAIRGGEYVAYDRADYRTALAVWLDSAQQGDPEAQNYVGEIYERGLGIPPDYRTAAEWYRRAAEQNFGPAQINLGQLHETGRGVPQDQVAALNWYRRASGFAEAGLTFVAATDVASGFAGLRDEVRREQAEADRLRAETEALRRQIAELERARLSAGRQQPAPPPPAAVAAAERPPAAFAAESAALERERAAGEAERQALAEERRRLAAERQDLEARRAELQQDAPALAEVERSLADLRARESVLEERSGALAAREAELTRRWTEMEAREAQVAEREARLQGSQAAVEERQQEAERLDRELAELQRAFEERRQQLAALDGGGRQNGAADGAADGPRIILIDPELPAATEATRGTTPVIRVRSGTTERPIVGRLEASAGMLSMLVNDRETSWDSNGVFQAAVPVPPDGTRVQMVAIDKLGRRSTLDFTLAPEGQQTAALTPDTVESAPRPSLPPIEFGRYHALVIGNNAYTRIPKLETAIADAEAVAGILERKYGFQVTLLRDADRYQILSALNQLRATLTEQDNLLIYYAGHGELDEANMRGHWLPVDAEPDSSANWISNIQLTDVLNVMKAKHVLVVADSCYSGALTRSAIARLEGGMTEQEQVAWMKAVARKRSRTALTSGGLAPTLDGGGGGHSVFARALLDALEANRDVLSGLSLFQEVAARVTYAAERIAFDQTPQYAPVKFAGHEAGEFFLVPRT